MTRFRAIAVSVAAALALTGCVGEPRRPPTTAVSVPATAPPTETTRPVATTTTAPPPAPTTTTTVPPSSSTTAVDAGPVTIVEAAPGRPLLVGGFLPFSGDDAEVGTAQADAVQLAVGDFGDIAGHDVVLAPFEDTRCSVDGGRAAARSVVASGAAVSGSPVVGIIGPTCAAAAVDGVPLLVDAGFTVVAPTVDDPSFFADPPGEPGALRRDGFVTVAPHVDAVAHGAAAFVEDFLGASRPAVVVVSGDASGERSAEAFAAAALGLDIPIVGVANAPVTEIGGAIRRLGDVAPDALFLAVGAEDAPAVVAAIERIVDDERAAAEEDEFAEPVIEGVPLVMSVEALVPEVAAADGASDAYFVEVDEGPRGDEDAGLDVDDVRAAYERAFGREPTTEALRAYDATMLLLAAVAAVVEDRDGTAVIDRRRIPESLGEVSVSGFFGSLGCDDFGRCLDSRIRVVEEDDSAVGPTLANEVWSN